METNISIIYFENITIVIKNKLIRLAIKHEKSVIMLNISSERLIW